MSEVIQFAKKVEHVDEGRRTRTGRGRLGIERPVAALCH
jgi:hypothetical protein